VLERVWRPDGAPEPAQLADLFAEQGVDVALLFCEYSPKTTGYQSFDDLLPLVEHDPRLFRPVANVNPNLHHPIARELSRQLDHGAAALKLHPVHGGFRADDRALYPAYSVLVERGVPLVVHCGTSSFPGSTNAYADPTLLDAVLRDFPDLDVVLAHGGRGWWYDAAAFLALSNPRVWIELSGLPPTRLPEYYARFHLGRLARKWIYGTDWPGVPGVAANARVVAGVGLPADVVPLVLGGNALAVYSGLSTRAAECDGGHICIRSAPPARTPACTDRCGPLNEENPMTRALSVLGAAGAAALLPLALAVPASAQAAGAEVRVLHGIPGTPVDVYVNGERALDDFAPGTTTDNLALPAGTYEVAVFAADAEDNTGTPVIGPVDLAVPASGNVSAIAHLTEDGTPTLTPFVNDTAATPAGQGRVVVRHTAAAPAVDILVGGQAAISGLTNPNEETATLPAGTISAAVAAAGTTEPVIGPVDLPVTAGQSTIVYAIGSLSEDTLDALVQTVEVGEEGAAGGEAPAGETPAGVPAGSGGLVDQGGVPSSVVLATGLGVVVAAGGALALSRTRRQEQ